MTTFFKRTLIAVLALLATMFLMVGCGGGGEQEASEEGYHIKIFLNGNEKESLSLSDIQNLPQVTVQAKGKDQIGPTLLSVMDQAGISDYSKVTIVGLAKGRVASAELELNKDEIDDKVVLDITNSGTAKLASPNIDENKWIIDVSEIRAE